MNLEKRKDDKRKEAEMNANMELARSLLAAYDAKYAEFEKHLQTPQDRALYQRCRKMYQAEILAVLEARMRKEDEDNAGTDRRTDDDNPGAE